MRKPSLNSLLLLCALTAALSACTRKADKNTTITLNFGSALKSSQAAAKNVAVVTPSPTPTATPTATPSPAPAGAQGFIDDGYYADVVIVNVSQNSAPAFLPWHSPIHSQGNIPATLPIPPADYFTFNLAQGDTPLFQVLIVENPLPTTVNGKTQFLYGWATQKISGDNNVVNIANVDYIQSGSGSSGGDSRIGGRYLNSAGKGPTGKILAYYKPNGQPRMLVDNNGEVFGGWFSTFALEGANLQYTFDDGTDIFGAPTAADSATLLPTTATDAPRVMRIYTPGYYYQQDQNSGLSYQDHTYGIAGWFGPGAAGKKVCYLAKTHSVPYAYTDKTATTTLQWNPAPTGTPGAGDVYVQKNNGIRGGLGAPADSDGICQPTGSTGRYVDYIPFLDSMVTNRDQALGFQGPFRLLSPSGGGGSNAIDVELVSGAINVAWQFLPGVRSVDGGGLDGVEIFGRIESTVSSGNNDNADYRNTSGDGVACDNLQNLGFISLADPALTVDSSLKMTTTITSGLPAGFAVAFGQSLTTVIACPYAKVAGSKNYFTSAAVSSGSNSGCGSCGATGNKLDMRFVGVNTTQPINYGAGLGIAPYTMLKSDVINGAHNFMFIMGGMVLNMSDLSTATAQASIDNGVTWTSINISANNYAGMSVGLLPISSATPVRALHDLINSQVGDTVLQIKLTLSATVQASYGLTNGTYTSGPITLLDSGNCTAANAGGLELWDVTNTSSYPDVDTMMGEFAGTNGSDVKKTLSLTWQNCEQAQVSFDSMAVTGTSSPNGCFGPGSALPDSANPFNFILDPKDSGSNCSINSPIVFNSPGYGLSSIGSSFTITHSTAVAAWVPVMSANLSPPSLGSNRLVLDLFNIGEGGQLTLTAGKVNADGQFVDTSTHVGIGSGATAWSVPVAAAWQASPSGSVFNLTSAMGLSGTPIMGKFNISDTAINVSSSFPGAVVPGTAAVLATSQNTLDGGSPVMVIAATNSMQLAYIPSNSSTFYGSSLVTLNLPSDAGITSTPAFVKVFTWGGNGGNYIYVAAGFTPGTGGVTKYMMGVQQGHGNTTAIKWEPTVTNPVGGATDLLDAAVIPTNSGTMVAVHATAWEFVSPASENLDWGTLPTYNPSTSSWSGPTFISNQNNLGDNTNYRHLGLVKCGTELMAVGAANGLFQAKSFDPNGVGTASSATLADGSDVSTQTNVACAAVNGGGNGMGARVFLTYNPAITTHQFHAFEGGQTVSCGATLNATMFISGLVTGGQISYAPSVGGITVATGMNSGPSGSGFLMGWEAATKTYNLNYLAIAGCATGVVNMNDTSKQIWGSLYADSPTFTGLQVLQDPSIQSTQGAFTLFGLDHQFYMFHAN